MWLRDGQEAIPYANNTQTSFNLLVTYNHLPDTKFNLWDTFCLTIQIQISIEGNPHVDNIIKIILLIKTILNFKHIIKMTTECGTWPESGWPAGLNPASEWVFLS